MPFELQINLVSYQTVSECSHPICLLSECIAVLNNIFTVLTVRGMRKSPVLADQQKN